MPAIKIINVSFNADGLVSVIRDGEDTDCTNITLEHIGILIFK